MALIPLRIVKRWFRNNTVEDLDLDEIADKTVAWSSRVDNNLKQVGLDLNGDAYDFNNNGVRTQTSPIVGRLTALEAAASVGPRNLSVDVTTSPTTVSLVTASGGTLSTSDLGKVTINSTATAGVLIERDITENVDIVLTGAHWGFDTLGDFTNVPLFLLFIDDSTNGVATFGITAQAGQTTITSAQVKTVPGDITTIDKVLTATSLAATSNVTYWGQILADFDDTGGSSENLWTLKTAVGDVELHHQATNYYASFRF